MDINYLLQDFISNNKYICELAIAEGWIGNYYQTQISEGLLGYMVFSYQKHILRKLLPLGSKPLVLLFLI